MEKMKIRECLTTDYEAIYLLNKNVFGYIYDIEKTKQRLNEILKRKTHKVYVACMDGEVVGYIHGSDYECIYCDSLKNIMAIAVDSTYQGSGIGKALLTTIEDWAKQCNCQGIRLVSGMDREGAHRFYHHCGYSLRKQQKNFIKYFK